MTTQEQYNLCLELLYQLELYFNTNLFKVYYNVDLKSYYIKTLNSGYKVNLMATLADSIELVKVWNIGNE